MVNSSWCAQFASRLYQVEQPRKSIRRLCRYLIIMTCFASTTLVSPASAFEIVVDYKYDTNNFFDSAEKRAVLEAAAARYSRIIDSELLAIDTDYEIPCGNGVDQLCPSAWRIGFSHPGTGELYQVSTTESEDVDIISIAADEYGFPGLQANQWILYAGGGPISSAGKGGTATGANYTGTYDDENGPMHRGVFPSDPIDSIMDLPTWGGSVAFDTRQAWYFDLDSVPELGSEEIDFYTIALHEIGHALGMSTTWNQWQQHVNGEYYNGDEAVAAYNEDNNTSVSQLRLVNNFDSHWQNTSDQQSFIFSAGEPTRVGTAGRELQDLLLDPQASFTPDVARFELTNVDVASLRDIGWSTIEPLSNSLDLNNDSVVDAQDVDLACAAGGQNIDAYLTELNSTLGDVDLDGVVAFSDFLAVSTYFGTEGPYSRGDLSCDGEINFGDFLAVSTYFGNRASAASVSNVPEPSSSIMLCLAASTLAMMRRSRSVVTDSRNKTAK